MNEILFARSPEPETSGKNGNNCALKDLGENIKKLIKKIEIIIRSVEKLIQENRQDSFFPINFIIFIQENFPVEFTLRKPPRIFRIFV